jgi:hypothetical protein
MSLKKYFEQTQGRGILSTADKDGNVDAAVYSRPHCMTDGTLALIMRDRLSHRYLQTNPHAAYLVFFNINKELPLLGSGEND